MTDSACFHGWIKSMLEGFGRPKEVEYSDSVG